VALVVAILLALLVLDPPWDVAVVVGAAFLELAEIGFWFWYSKRRAVQVGAETLVGLAGTVVTACRPRGQVRVQGEIWNAVARDPADAGAAVRVVGRDGLTLVVEAEPR
jgi:membrane protein implicated in regulation of membrane protease activity